MLKRMAAYFKDSVEDTGNDPQSYIHPRNIQRPWGWHERHIYKQSTRC